MILGIHNNKLNCPTQTNREELNPHREFQNETLTILEQELEEIQDINRLAKRNNVSTMEATNPTLHPILTSTQGAPHPFYSEGLNYYLSYHFK